MTTIQEAILKKQFIFKTRLFLNSSTVYYHNLEHNNTVV